MTTFVVGTGSVHASAALCDYLDGRLAGGDAVHAAAWAVGSGPDADRDAEDALNGVRSRLGVRATVETHRLDEGGAGEEVTAGSDGVVLGLRALADRTAADEVIVVVGSGADDGDGDGNGGLGSGAVAELLSDATRPVVAVPTG